MSGRESLIDSMLALREKLLDAAKPEAGARVLYYPPELVEQARIFWGGAYRIEPTQEIPTDPASP